MFYDSPLDALKAESDREKSPPFYSFLAMAQNTWFHQLTYRPNRVICYRRNLPYTAAVQFNLLDQTSQRDSQGKNI